MKSGVKTYKLRGCEHCGGDAFPNAEDPGEWKCLQCARPVHEELAAVRLEIVHEPTDRLLVHATGG